MFGLVFGPALIVFALVGLVLWFFVFGDDDTENSGK